MFDDGGGAVMCACPPPSDWVIEPWRFADPSGADGPRDDDAVSGADLLDVAAEAAVAEARAVWAAEDARADAEAVASRVGDDGGPVTLADLEALLAVAPDSLDDGGRVAWLAAVGRAAAWLESRLDDGLLAVAGERVRLVCEPRGVEGQRRGAVMVDPDRDEVAVALRCSVSHADARITTARRLAGLLPATRAALREGRIDQYRAAVVAEAAGELLRGLPEGADPTGSRPDPGLVPAAVEVCARLEARVLPRAGERPVPALRRSCARAVHRLDPAAALRRARAARRHRDVWVTPLPDGQAMLSARMDAALAQACLRAVEHAAAQLQAQATRDGHPAGAGVAAGVDRRAGEWRVEALGLSSVLCKG